MYAHRIKETTETVGTGDLVLSGAPVGYRRFSFATSSPARVHYLIEWDGGFEIGFGEFDGQNRISRLFVTSDSASARGGEDFGELAGTGQPFLLPVGTKTVSLISPAAGSVACPPALPGDLMSDLNCAPRASGERSTAAGWGAFAAERDSVALGFGAVAGREGSIRLGNGASRSPNSLSFGAAWAYPDLNVGQSADGEFVVSECIILPALQGEIAGPFVGTDEAWFGDLKLICVAASASSMIKCDLCVVNGEVSVSQISTVFGSFAIPSQDISFTLASGGLRMIVINNQLGSMRISALWSGIWLGAIG